MVSTCAEVARVGSQVAQDGPPLVAERVEPLDRRAGDGSHPPRHAVLTALDDAEDPPGPAKKVACLGQQVTVTLCMPEAS